ncbi:MAG TPA: hypothetical protein VG297_10925 [Bryobacteraceae bacterium]|nr:hypothetical protein [Bryobacteraceae bacterium]
MLATILLGFGMSAVFSETELIRYPFRAGERFVARHFLGIADPFWVLMLILELGLVPGMFIWGATALVLRQNVKRATSVPWRAGLNTVPVLM